MPEEPPFRFHWQIYLVMATLTISGCSQSGPTSWPVTGKVTFQGIPVSVASIRFSNPQAGVDVTAKLDKDGKYIVVTGRGAGLPEGTYDVAMMPSRKGVPVGVFLTSQEPDRLDIPEKYQQPTTSNLKLAVKPGSNQFDVDMQP